MKLVLSVTQHINPNTNGYARLGILGLMIPNYFEDNNISHLRVGFDVSIYGCRHVNCDHDKKTIKHIKDLK